MAKLSMECKKMMVKEMSDRLKDAGILIVTSYKGLSAQDMDELRREIRDVSAEYFIVKDAIARKAIKESSHKDIESMVQGEVGIVLEKREDPSNITKVLVKFAKDHESLKIRGGLMFGETLSIDNIKDLASLPSKEVLLGKLANVLNAPIQGLAGALNAIICKFLYALNALKNKKEKEPKPAAAAKPEEKKEETAQKPEESKEEKPVEAKEHKEEPKKEEGEPTEDKKEEKNG